jgi:hypothetical protein
MIPIFTAFIAVGGVIFAARMSLLQVRKNHVIKARIDWLDKLKDLIAYFITDSYDITRITSKGKKDAANKKEEEKSIIIKEAKDHAFTKRIILEKWFTLIKLQLNTTEPLSQKLIEKIQECLDYSDNLVNNVDPWSSEDFDHLDNLNREIQEIASCVLKLEWEVTKSGDIKYKDEFERNNLERRYKEKYPLNNKDKTNS